MAKSTVAERDRLIGDSRVVPGARVDAAGPPATR